MVRFRLQEKGELSNMTCSKQLKVLGSLNSNLSDKKVVYSMVDGV